MLVKGASYITAMILNLTMSVSLVLFGQTKVILLLLKPLYQYLWFTSSAAHMHQLIRSALVQIMACHLFDTKPLSKPTLGYC